MGNRLTDNDVLKLLESGANRSSVERALLMLSTTHPDMTWQQLSALSVGQRDAKLLSLRERTFGSVLDVFTTCPNCQQELELSLTTTNLLIPAPADIPESDSGISTVIGDMTVRFRLPDSTDLQAVNRCENVETARKLLIDRCIVDIQGDSEQLQRAYEKDGKSYTAEFEAALAGQMSELDPQAEIRLNLKCTECDHKWQSLFDIAAFFWTELESHAKRLLNEIHILARVYHWHERDILALTPMRRHWYLEMVTA